MIYVMGMSHVVSLLQAVATGQSPDLENWAGSTSTDFTAIPAKPGMVPGDVLYSLIISNQGWEQVAQMAQAEDGSRILQGHPGYVALLSRLQPLQEQAMLVSILHGSAHAALSLVRHPQPFDFILSGHEDLPFIDGAQPIAEAVIRRQIEPYQRSTIATLALARVALPGMRLVHVFSPPPTESEEEIRRVPEGFRQHLDYFGITPLALRLKYYHLANRIVREGLQAMGVNVRFVDPPPQAIAPSGGLKAEYSHGATHANEAYGALLAAELKRIHDGER